MATNKKREWKKNDEKNEWIEKGNFKMAFIFMIL